MRDSPLSNLLIKLPMILWFLGPFLYGWRSGPARFAVFD